MRIVCYLSICSLLMFFTTPAFAVNPDRDIHQLGHRSWGEKEGYPGRAEVLAQTSDGFLWIGSDNGLFRFDGVQFERYEPISGDQLPAGPVRSLLALSDGSLWIAYRLEDTIRVLQKGNVKTYGEGDGVTSRPTNIIQDKEGSLWASTEAGLIRFNGHRWEQVGKDWDFPEDVPKVTSQALFEDSRGNLWVGVNHTVLYLRQGSKRFEPTGVTAEWSTSIAESPDGTIWLADILSDVRPIGTSGGAMSAGLTKDPRGSPRQPQLHEPSSDQSILKIKGVVQLLFDRDGSLWMTTDTAGVLRISHAEALLDRSASGITVQTFASTDGLSADTCDPILEDREGDIWLGTRDGLDQFRATPMVPVVLPKSLYRAGIAPADGGDLWVVGSWAYAGNVHGGVGAPTFLPSDAFKTYRDRSGNTWFLGSSLERWENGGFQKIAPSPPTIGNSGSGTWQIASDASGKLWAFSSGHGFFFLDQHRWQPWPTLPEIAKQQVVNMFSDSTGRIWVSTFEGGIITMEEGSVAKDFLRGKRPLSYVKAFAERSPQQIWAGGVGGLALIEKHNVHAIKPAAAGSLNDVTGIVDAGSEGLWLNTSGGVVHIPREELDRALRDSSYRFQSKLFSSPDGLPGLAESLYPYPKAVQGTDGRIWFTATRGVAWVDPNSIPRNPSPPPVSITSVSADGSEYRQLSALGLPPNTANIQINYSALSLSVPERVLFRYKLEGVDREWQEAGTRRSAFYTGLSPGNYLFRVIASNDDGVWNNTGAYLGFSVAAAWYQTRLFQALCAVAFFLLLWVLYGLRVRSIQSRARELDLINGKLQAQIESNAILFADLRLQVSLLQEIPVAAWTLKPDGTPDFVNQVWLDYSGQTPDFVRSHPEAWMTAVHPEDRGMASKLFWEGVSSGQGFAFETRSRRVRDGTYRWHLQQAVVLRGEDGQVLKFVGTTTDIDNQKRNEEALRQTQAELAHVARVAMLNAMTASITHEVSQPLVGILTNANTCVLTSDPPNLIGAVETVRRTIRDANRATEVIQRLRTMFSKRPSSVELVDLNDAVREVLALSMSELQRNQVVSRTDFADNLPLVSADRVQLQQVILNLFLNATDAMAEIGNQPKALEIKTELYLDAGVRLAVSDSGIGVNPSTIEKLFEPFYTTKAKGMGIGLSICRSIVESCGGQLWAMKNDGPGATFSFSIPAATPVHGASVNTGNSR